MGGVARNLAKYQHEIRKVKLSLERKPFLGGDCRRSNARRFSLADSPVCVNIPLFIKDPYDNHYLNYAIGCLLPSLQRAGFQLEKEHLKTY